MVHATSTGDLDFDVNVNHAAGLFDIRTGTVSLDRNVAGGGSFQVAAGSTLEFNGTTVSLAGSAVITGAGTVNFNDPGTLTLPGTYTVTGTTNVNLGTVIFPQNTSVSGLVLDGGDIGVTGQLTVTDQLVWMEGGISGASGAVLAANGGAQLSTDNNKWLAGVTFANAGTATWAGAGPLLFINGATWNNPAGSVLDAQGDAAMYFLSGQPTGFTNAGLFKKSAGTGVTYISTALTNSGTMQALSGTLAFGSGGESTGTLATGTGGTLDLNDGTYTLASVGGTGIFSLSGATATVNGALVAGTINVTDGSLTVGGAVTATTLAVTDDAGTTTATFNGTVSVGTFTARQDNLVGQLTVVF